MEDTVARVLRWLAIVAAVLAAAFAELPAIYQALLVVISVDVISGVLLAWSQKDLNSDIAAHGIYQKAGELLLILVAAYVQQVVPGTENIPLPEALAGFYTYYESLSILENLAALGVPIPEFLRSALSKLSPDKNLDRQVG
jgi:toxin secretion/phage lysis holin